jgi:hypothetical protein
MLDTKEERFLIFFLLRTGKKGNAVMLSAKLCEVIKKNDKIECLHQEV